MGGKTIESDQTLNHSLFSGKTMGMEVLFLPICFRNLRGPPLIPKRGGLESSGPRLISSIGKTKRGAFFTRRKKNKIKLFSNFQISCKKRDFFGFLTFFQILQLLEMFWHFPIFFGFNVFFFGFSQKKFLYFFEAFWNFGFFLIFLDFSVLVCFLSY